MWQKVKNLEYTFPDGFDEVAKDLVQKLLVSVFHCIFSSEIDVFW